MAKIALNNLEAQIDKLIAAHQRLKLENTALQKKVTTLNVENIALLDKKKKVIIPEESASLPSRSQKPRRKLPFLRIMQSS